MDFIGFILFMIVVLIIGILPFPLLYLLSNLVRYIIQYIVRYRTDLVYQNLRSAFPEKTKDEILRLAGLYYKHLADVLLEGIKSFTMSRRQILRRHRIINPEILEPFVKTNQSIIGVTAHYNNWEWGSLSASLQVDLKAIAFYKPLNNKHTDWLVRWSRSRFGTMLASISCTALTFEENLHQKTMFLMAADQGMPSKYKHKAYWIQFLNHDTPFLHGPERYSRLHNLPVIYIEINRAKRGFYEIELSVLVSNPNELPDGEITRLYASKLESVIKKKPENWLWSHRRWRLSR